MRADITVGATFPDYELPDHTGRLRLLSEIQGNDPMIIVLAREPYSAKDQRQHEGLRELWREMKPGVGYCKLVTITTTDLQETLDYHSGVGAEWPFLSDPTRIVQRDLDIPEYTDPDHNQMVPHTIVCEPGLVIYKIYNGYWFFGRPTVEELRHDLRAVLMKIHWDWDLSDPEVRAAWRRGEMQRFYPPDIDTSPPGISKLSLRSETFADGMPMPVSVVSAAKGCGGGNRSPHLVWSGEPSGNASFAVIMHDLDAPTGTGWFHWVVFNIPPNVHELKEGAGTKGSGELPLGAILGLTDFGVSEYGGPCPPSGQRPHRYELAVYALSSKVNGSATTTAAALRLMMHSNTLARGRIAGTLGR